MNVTLKEKTKSNMEFIVGVMSHYNLSCKDCSFSCSGENIEMLRKHIEECSHCSNKQCGYTTERHLMKDQSATCSSAMVNCPNIRCNVEKNRKEMLSHEETCPFRIVPCQYNCYGRDKSMTDMDRQKHHRTCPYYSCVICKKYVKPEERSAHNCVLQIIKSLNKEESLKCTFCEYKDVCRSKVLLHMVDCKHSQRECQHCCKEVLLTEWEEHLLSNCNATVRCTECTLRIER